MDQEINIKHLRKVSENGQINITKKFGGKQFLLTELKNGSLLLEPCLYKVVRDNKNESL